MTSSRIAKGTLIVLIVLLSLSLASNIITAKSAMAEKGQDQIGRYQVSAWASYSGSRVHHSGYYVVDTVTGKIVEKGHEIHGIEGPNVK